MKRGPYKTKWPPMPRGAITAEIVREMLSYDPETGLFTYKVTTGRGKKGNIAGVIHHSGYHDISVRGNVFRAHRLAWLYVYGQMPSVDIDHINGMRSDNRIVNLRLATRFENMQNKGLAKSSTSGVTGVSLHRLTGKWQAYLTANKKRRHLGLFETKEEAIAVHSTAKAALHPFNPVTVRDAHAACK